jgi:hypothetical protein
LNDKEEATMNYLLESRGDNFFGIVNADANVYVGHVSRRGGQYHVSNNEDEDIAIVKAPEGALPVIAAHYETHPPQWKRESAARFSKWMQFGELRVDQEQTGQWVAYRNGFPLLRNGNPATFVTCKEAQHAADVHAREGYPNSETIFDGFAWRPDPDPWWSYPNRIAVLRPGVAAFPA